jgi:sRNA-binding carbon storage regulator CsrA
MPLRQDEIRKVIEIARKIAKEEIEKAMKDLEEKKKSTLVAPKAVEITRKEVKKDAKL